MDLKQCGRTGLYLSPIGIGTLTWGRDTDGPEALDMLRRFVDAGGNLVECSASHGDGMAVDILSQAISAVGRHRVAVAWRGGVRRACINICNFSFSSKECRSLFQCHI